MLVVAAAFFGAPAQAQPEPSFRSNCKGLREALRRLGPTGDELVTIQVEGALTMIRGDGALVYLALCSAPDPQVLCVTYAENGRKVGDVVVASGSYARVGPNHVKLDPCLHHLPNESGD